ncbi:hypothetical protein Mapa_014662 [Marchantia paleacea]|nr:hypothetical protein Mapa_014662 [Marchantia paleacea]
MTNTHDNPVLDTSFLITPCFSFGTLHFSTLDRRKTQIVLGPLHRCHKPYREIHGAANRLEFRCEGMCRVMI